MFDIEALQTPGYSLKIALAMALGSQLAYSDKDTVISTATGWGFDKVEHLSSDDTQGFIATKDDIVMVAFRGTESIGDWLTNIQISKKRINYGRVHKGFFKAFKDVRDPVRSALEERTFRNRFFCGHSLGGALATIAMAETADVPATNTAGYTYGQPKVGKRDFRDRFNDETQDGFFRYVNDGDWVEHRSAVTEAADGELTLLHWDAMTRDRLAAAPTESGALAA